MLQSKFEVRLLAKVARKVPEYKCSCGACPAVLKTSRETFVVVGLKMSEADKAAVSKAGELGIGADEDAVEIPQELVDLLKRL
jgi:hypothetical protein